MQVDYTTTEKLMGGKEYTKTRGVGSNFALVGQKGVGPGRRKWEDLLPPPVP